LLAAFLVAPRKGIYAGERRRKSIGATLRFGWRRGKENKLVSTRNQYLGHRFLGSAQGAKQ
jgi:hypothetical protein